MINYALAFVLASSQPVRPLDDVFRLEDWRHDPPVCVEYFRPWPLNTIQGRKVECHPSMRIYVGPDDWHD
jgi:hypothetical protein